MPMKSKGRTGPTRNDKSERLKPRAKSDFHGTGDVNNSYRYSKETLAPTGRPVDSKGFSRTPKQGKSKLTSSPFPDNYDSVGNQAGVKGDGGMAHRQPVGGGKYPTYDYGK